MPLSCPGREVLWTFPHHHSLYLGFGRSLAREGRKWTWKSDFADSHHILQNGMQSSDWHHCLKGHPIICYLEKGLERADFYQTKILEPDVMLFWKSSMVGGVELPSRCSRLRTQRCHCRGRCYCVVCSDSWPRNFHMPQAWPKKKKKRKKIKHGWNFIEGNQMQQVLEEPAAAFVLCYLARKSSILWFKIMWV